MIEIRYFAALREALQCDREQLPLPAGVRTVAELRRHLIARGGIWEQLLDEQRALMSAVNEQLCAADAPVTDGDSVALFPPVTGG